MVMLSSRLFVPLIVTMSISTSGVSAKGIAPSGRNTAAEVYTTAQRQIFPIGVAAGTPQISPSAVAQYAQYGYSAWQFGAGLPYVKRTELAPAYKGASGSASLLSFFSISDIHITDKESPAQVPWFGWSAPFNQVGLYSQAYSPVLLSTTQVLDSAVQTINALHKKTPFDFGISLGDVANSSQFNELRWFIDVLDGKVINPSSGDHRGAASTDYQKPYKAAGLDHSIPWYEVIGNHDQFWMGVGNPDAKIQNALVGSEIMNIGPNLFATNNVDGKGVYVGVIDGATPYGDVINGGPADNYATPPIIVADPNRHSITTDVSTPTGYTEEFFNTSSLPVGHGFSRSNPSACYTFVPKSDMPIKVIVLDDTCKTTDPNASVYYYGAGWIDAGRYAWLTNELQKGQDAGQLMIIACHIPISPQKDLANTTRAPQFYPSSYKSEAQLIDTLRKYPNLIMLMAGHRHINVVTPQPSLDPAHPENGFWEVETSSLRDFPREFRTFDVRRNSDNTISIITTDVDPQVEPGSVAAKSLGYAIAAARIFGNTPLTDTSSHAYNAELVKQLTPEMQKKIARLGNWTLGR